MAESPEMAFRPTLSVSGAGAELERGQQWLLARRLSRQPTLLATAARVTPFPAVGLTAWTAGVGSKR